LESKRTHSSVAVEFNLQAAHEIPTSFSVLQKNLQIAQIARFSIDRFGNRDKLVLQRLQQSTNGLPALQLAFVVEIDFVVAAELDDVHPKRTENENYKVK
jgi:hypothetical protein